MQPGKYFNIKTCLNVAALIAASILLIQLTNIGNEELEKYMPEERPLASAFNKKPSGVSGLFQIAVNSGLKMDTWHYPYRRLHNIKGMLVVIAPSQSLSGFDVDEILAWVHDGNQLLYLDDFTYKFSRRLINRIGLGIKKAESPNDSCIPVFYDRREFLHVKSLTINSNRRLVGGTGWLSDKSGVLLAAVSVGKGRVLVGAVQNLAPNRYLSASKNWPNFQFLVNIFRTVDGAIIFDERCHGFSQSTNVWAYLAQLPPGHMAMQLGLIFFVAVFSAAQRFGRTKQLVTTRKISNLDYIQALSSTYLKAGANFAVWQIICHSFRTKLCRSLSISGNESEAKIIERWRAFAHTTESENHADVLGKLLSMKEGEKTLSDKRLTELVCACDKITQQVREISSLS